MIAGLQEDLQFIPPRRDVVQDRVQLIFEHARGIVDTMSALSGTSTAKLGEVLDRQSFEVERYIAALQELATPRLAMSLSEVGLEDEAEAGGKAAYLGEIKNKIGLPVPNGFVLTTEAYRRFCGIPHWVRIRDATRAADLDQLDTIRTTSKNLQELVMETELPRAVEVAISDRARALTGPSTGFAVRSSAVGEGGAQILRRSVPHGLERDRRPTRSGLQTGESPPASASALFPIASPPASLK